MKLRSPLGVFVWMLIGMVLIAGCVGPITPATPTPDPAGDWQRIQAAGKLMVGISVDYPPFSYYSDQFRITGFDPALIEQIGARLGLSVQIKDIPFDGLADALRSHQIDVAISAITATPERDEFVDFSDVYYVGEVAILASANAAPVTIKSAADITQQMRVGVQNGSVYQTWVEETLVEPGLLPQRNLILYTDVGRAITDLRNERISLVILDARPAQQFAAQGGVVIIAQGLNRQRYAMAVRNGSEELRLALNAGLDELRNDGTLERLILEYLGLAASEIPPAPTAQPTTTATPTVVSPTAVPPSVSCTDGMAWVADLTYDDKNMTNPPLMAPGQSFVKGWRVRNSGTCTWDGRYRLAYAYGNTPAARMGGQPAPVIGVVPAGGLYDFYVSLVAPLPPGIYQGFWQMVNSANAPFGQRIWVGIRVAGPATPTPKPTQTPAPQISFTASPTNIRAGAPVAFAWSVQNAREVAFYAQGQNWWEHRVPPQGTRTEYPQRTTTYYLRVVSPDNTVQMREITIFVQAAPDAPMIMLFSVTPQGEIRLGQCVRIDWDVQGSVDRVNLLRNGGALWSSAPLRGSLDDCPPVPGVFEYRLDASGPGGQSRAVQYVTVVQPPQPTSTPTPTTAPPTPVPTTATPTSTPTSTTAPPTPTPTIAPPVVITYFSVDPRQIETGQCVTISWSVSGDPALVQIRRNGAVVQDNAPSGGNALDCPSPAGNYTYGIEATDQNGRLADAREVTVTVVEPIPPTATPAPAAPVIDYFDLSAERINEGDCVMMAWGYHGQDLAYTRIQRNGEVIVSDPPLTGEQSDCPPQAGQYTYDLIVDSEFGGSARQSRFLLVEPLVVPMPLPAPVEPGAQPLPAGG
jgi:polar amino acid transport system substrate-binding protein